MKKEYTAQNAEEPKILPRSLNITAVSVSVPGLSPVLLPARRRAHEGIGNSEAWDKLDVIFICTYEIHQFTGQPILLRILKDLKMEYKDVLFFTIIREEVMDTNRYLELCFPFRKLDFKKKGKDAAWFIEDDRTMLALALIFRKESDAQIMFPAELYRAIRLVGAGIPGLVIYVLKQFPVL